MMERNIIYFMINILISTQNNQIFQVSRYKIKQNIIMIAYLSKANPAIYVWSTRLCSFGNMN